MTIYRAAAYEGTPGADMTTAQINANTLQKVSGATATYDSNCVSGATAAKFQGNAYAIFNTSSTLICWSGAIFLPTTDPVTNRSIMQLDLTPKASVWWSSSGIQIRTTGGSTVDTYAGFVGGQWHWMEWVVNASGSTFDGVANGQQRLRIYDADMNLLDTLVGGCGSGWTSFREGQVSGGLDADYAIFDSTVLGNELVPVRLPVVGGGGVEEPPSYTAHVKVAGVETELFPFVKIGGVETPLTINTDVAGVGGGGPTVSAATPTTVATSLTNLVLNLSSSSPGDRLIMSLATRNVATITPPSGWSVVGTADSAATGQLTILTKVADGSEGATATFVASAGTTAASQCRTVSGASGSVSAAFANSGGATGSIANPPSLTLAAPAVVLAIMATAAAATVMSESPYGYSDGAYTLLSSGGASAGVATAHRTDITTTENPGSFFTTADRWWMAATVAVNVS